MAAKFFLVLSASALLVQAISGQCLGYSGARLANAELAAAEIATFNNGVYGCGAPAYLAGPIYGAQNIASASGGGFGVSSVSPIAPSGVSVLSENAIDGAVEVVGALPLLAAVAFEGNVPSAGSAGTSYSCGSGNVGISSESLAAAGIGYGAGLGAAYGAGLSAAYGAAGLGSGLNAEIAGLNAGLAGLNAGLAGARFGRPACGCGVY